MPTSLPTAAALRPQPGPRTAPPKPAAPGWLREPLLHFVVLGALLFAVDHAVLSRQDDPRRILVAVDVDLQARQLFKASRGREPDAAELQALRQRWVDNEVLYREGLALQVDKGDTAIRERVIFKALSVVDAGLQLPPVTEPALRQWFEQHRAKYDDPARYDFQEAALAGETSEAAVRAFVQSLNSGTPGDAKAGLRVFKGRPHSNIVQSYGAEFAGALETAAVGEWRALLTQDGWRAMRLDLITPPKPARFEVLHGVVRQDWTDLTMADLRTAQVRAMGQKYSVKLEAAQP